MIDTRTLLAAIVFGGMLIGLRCRNQFGRLVAFGISFNFCMYKCMINCIDISFVNRFFNYTATPYNK